MARVPALRKEPVAYRSQNESATQNRFQEDVFFDLMQAFSELNAQRVQIREAAEVFTTENKFLQLRLIQLQNALARLPLIPDAEGRLTATAFVSDMQPTAATPGIKPLALDELHRIATLPLARDGRISKVYLKDALTGEPFVPASTKIEALPEANGVTVADTSLRAALDGKDHTTWVRKVYAPLSSSVNSAEVQVTIMLPDDIVSTRDVNVITVHPFPAEAVDLVSVEVGLNDTWEMAPGFTPQQPAGQIRLCFPTRAVSHVRVTLRQRHWVEENGQKVFYLGAQEIGVYKETYGAQRAEFEIPVALATNDPETMNGPFRVESILPVVANQAALSVDARSLFSYSLYTVDEATGNLTYTQDQLPVLVHRKKLLIKATLHMDAQTGATPALEAVVIKYKT